MSIFLVAHAYVGRGIFGLAPLIEFPKQMNLEACEAVRTAVAKSMEPLNEIPAAKIYIVQSDELTPDRLLELKVSLVKVRNDFDSCNVNREQHGIPAASWQIWHAMTKANEFLGHAKAIEASSGPVGKNTLVWKGKTIRLQPEPFRILKMLWPKGDVAIDDVGINSEAGVKQVVNKANKALMAAGLSKRMSRKSGRIYLEDDLPK